MFPRNTSLPLLSTQSTHLLALLKQCSTLKHMNQAHAFMVSRGLDQDNHLLTKFVDACSRLGLATYAYSVFTRKERPPDLFLLNTMINVLSQTGLARDAIALYSRIQAMDFRPNSYSFPSVLKAVAHLSVLALGKQIHAQSIRIGISADVYVGTGLIRMYSACREICAARLAFDGLLLRHVMLWNAMIGGYAKLGDMVCAREIFERMPDRNVVSWTTMIAVYAQGNRPTEAIDIFWRMQTEENMELDEVALLAVLSACADLGALELGKWIHSYTDIHCLCKTVPLMNALIDMYAKSGDIRKALEVFESMECRSVISWTMIIAGLALHGLGAEALNMFSRMEMAKVEPNEVAFLAILSACSHVGLVELGLWHFERMSSRYQMKPRIEHYGCMVDLLGRAGILKEAIHMVEHMPFKPNAAILGSLLGAARIHGNVELGEYALRHLIDVEPHNSGNYSLLSNIYASNGNWDAAGNVRKLMRDRGVKKAPGGSSIELNGMVHEFIARDRSHPLSERIYEVLHEIKRQLKTMGHVPREYGGVFNFEDG